LDRADGAEAISYRRNVLDDRVVLRGQAPHGHWQTLTFLAALRHDRIEAPSVLVGPINGESFKAYIEQFLVAMLSPRHRHHEQSRQPFEQVFAKLKMLLRKAAERTVEATLQRELELCSVASHVRNAPTISETPDMPLPNWTMLRSDLSWR
jgi:hypothetical protein